MKTQLFLVCSITFFSIKAQNSETDSTQHVPKKTVEASWHYFTLVYENESGGGPQNGFSFGYMVSPAAKRKYYIGINNSFLSAHSKDASFEYNLSAISFNLTQRVFLGQRARVSPFLDFDLGYRIIHNSAEVPITYGAKAPGIWGTWGFRYATGGEDTDIKSINAFTEYIGMGCFFSLTKKSGIVARLGCRMTDQFELIDKNSLGTTSNHATPDHELGYNTYFTKSPFVTFSLGFIFGK